MTNADNMPGIDAMIAAGALLLRSSISSKLDANPVYSGIVGFRIEIRRGAAEAVLLPCDEERIYIPKQETPEVRRRPK